MAEARALGVGEVIAYEKFDVAPYRKAFDVVFDTAGSLSPGRCLSMLRATGVALHIDLTPSKMIRVLLTRRNKGVFAKTPPAILERLGRLAADGRLRLPIAAVVPLARAIPEITTLETGGKPKGKLVIVPG